MWPQYLTSRINFAPSDDSGPGFIPDSARLFGPANAPVPSNNGQPTKEDKDKNTDADDDNTGLTDNIWDTSSDDEEKNKDDVSKDDTNQITPEEFWNNHIKELGLEQVFDESVITTALSEGNVKPLVESINKAVVAGYKAGLTNSSKIVNNKLSSFRDEILEASQGQITAHEYTAQLEAAIPIIKSNKNLAPVARTVFKQLLERHKGDVAKSIQGTKTFFKQIREADTDDLGLPNDPANIPGSGNFNSKKSTADDIDFLSVLRGNK